MKAKIHLIVQTAFLGDLLLTVPLLQNLKKIYPSDKIYLVCRSGFADFVLQLNLVDQVFEVKKGDSSSYKQALKTLKNIEFQNIFCVHRSIRSQFFVFSLRAANKIGYKNFWNFFIFNKRVKRLEKHAEVFKQIDLLATVNEEVNKKIKEEKKRKSYLMEYQIPAWLSMQNYKKSDTAFKRVVLAPGSVWATKRWTAKGFVQVAKFFSEKGYEVVTIGSKEDQNICDYIKNEWDPINNLCAKTNLSELLELLDNSCLLISNDSGAMHMASLVGCKTISIFGPTTLDLGYRPWQNSAKTIEIDLKCRPCGKHGHKECPLGTHECMIGISSSLVIQAAKGFLVEDL